MVIDEDPFPPTASINIAASDSRAMLRYGFLSNTLLIKMTKQQKEERLQPENGKRMEGIHTIHLKTQNRRQRTSSLRKRMFL